MGGGSGPASLLCFQRARGQSQSKPPSASTGRTLGLRVILGVQDLGSLRLGPPIARVPLKLHGPHACLKPELSHLGTGSVCKRHKWRGCGPMGRATWFSLRQQMGRPWRPERTRESLLEGTGPLTVPCASYRPDWPCDPQHPPPWGGARPVGAASNVLPPNLRGHRDSGVVARVGPTGCLGLVWPHFFSWETGLSLPLVKLFTLPWVGTLAAVRACTCMCVCTRVCLYVGLRRHVEFELALAMSRNGGSERGHPGQAKPWGGRATAAWLRPTPQVPTQSRY